MTIFNGEIPSKFQRKGWTDIDGPHYTNKHPIPS